MIRRATLEDEEKIFGLMPELGYGGEPAGFSDAFCAVLQDPYQAVWIAGDGDGMLAMTFRPQMRLRGILATIDEMIVIPRGQGIGTRLLRAGLDESHARGAVRIELHTQRKRESYARGFYAKNGFVEIDSAVMRLEVRAEVES
jgi:GNAT superfamily N-acetyltransferase